MAILTSVKSHCRFDLHFLKISNVEHFFICPLAGLKLSNVGLKLSNAELKYKPLLNKKKFERLHRKKQ